MVFTHLLTGEVETDPSVYQVKVLSPSECAKELRGVSPNMYCIVRHKNSHRPAAAAAVSTLHTKSS